MKDKDIKHLLAQKGIHLSVRMICNCRKLLNIPNYKERATYYDKNIAFSDYIVLTKGNLNRIPAKAGVYELSISSKIDYLDYRSNVIYIGRSQNLKKRIRTYSGNKLKNKKLKEFIDNYNLLVRFYLTEKHISVEKKLLSSFRNIHRELPKANSLGG